MDWLDSLREFDLVARLRELDLMAELREVPAQLGDVVNGAASDWLRELNLLAELRELVATAGVDASQLAGLVVAVLPLAWWLMHCWRIWNRRGRGRGAVPLWGVIAVVAGTVRFFVIVLVAFFGVVMVLGRLDGAGRCQCRW